MTSKIFRSVFYTSIIVLLLSMILIMGMLYGFFEQQLEAELKSEADYIQYAIEENKNGFFADFKQNNKRVTLIDKDGTVLADTEADVALMDNHSGREEFIAALENGAGTSTRYSKTLTEKTIYYARRLTDGTVLRISTTQYSLLTIMLGLAQPMLVIFIIIFILSLVLSSKVSKSIIKPINSIDLDNVGEAETYEELSPLLLKILHQKKMIDKQVSEAKHNQEEFRLITENMSEGFIVIDEDEKILSYNSAVLKLLNSQITDNNVLSLNRTREFRDTVTSALNGKKHMGILECNDKMCNLIANPVKENDKIVGAVMVIIDVTETAKAESIRREFTANVSHELKTPLTSISGFAELLKEGNVPNDTVVDFSNTIYSEAQRLISLVNDIIKISALDEKSDYFMLENIELDGLTREIVDELKPAADKKNVKFSIDGENAVINGARQIIYEMVYNLCDNAIKYNKDNGRVNIHIENLKDCVTFEISDTGIGIPEDSVNRVFERFYRVDKSRSKAEGGTGLGLSIVKHGAIYHDAEIAIESVVDKGTTITLRFKK